VSQACPLVARIVLAAVATENKPHLPIDEGCNHFFESDRPTRCHTSGSQIPLSGVHSGIGGVSTELVLLQLLF
jgi:hypothetical protein